MARRNRESSKREAGNLKTKSFILVYPFKNPWLYSRQVSDHTRTMKKLLENHQRIGRQVPELIIWLPLLHFFKVIDSIRQLWRSLIQCSNSVISLRHVSVSRHERWGGGGKGVLNKVLYGDAPPRGPTHYPSIHHFWQKRYPFRTLSVDKSYPLYIPCLELCIPFNCCKCTVFFKYE